MISILIIGFFLVFFLWNWFFYRLWDQKLSVQLSFDRMETFAGQKAALVEQVENRKKLPLPVLEVRFSLKRGLSMEGIENINVSDHIYKRDVFSLLGMQRISRRMDFICEKRGYYEIREAEVATFSLLFEKTCFRKMPQETGLYVYPKTVNVQNILKAVTPVLGEIQREKTFCEDPFAFRSIREYTTLDPPKYINWKASAKTGHLMVNTFDSSLRGKIMLYLDVSDEGICTYEHLTEESISVTASLADYFIKNGLEAGLSINDGEKGTVFHPKGGRFQAVKILRHLAKYDKNQGVCPFSSILKDPPEHAVCLIVSKNADAQEAVLNFRRQEKSCIWIYPVSADESETLPGTQGLEDMEIIVRKVEKE